MKTKHHPEKRPNYLPTTQSYPKGEAPQMQYAQIGDASGVKYFVLSFKANDDVLGGIMRFATEQKVTCANFSGIGSLKTGIVGYLDDEKEAFRLNYIDKQVEVTSLLGNISIYNQQPFIHSHINLAKENAHVRGGHLISGTVYPILEVFVTVYPYVLIKEEDPKTHLKSIQIKPDA